MRKKSADAIAKKLTKPGNTVVIYTDQYGVKWRSTVDEHGVVKREKMKG